MEERHKMYTSKIEHTFSEGGIFNDFSLFS